MQQPIEQLQHFSQEEIRSIAKQWGTPVFAYDEQVLRRQAGRALAFPAPFGLTVRYAMKANPSRHILQLFHRLGVHIDASSGYEAHRAMRVGVPAQNILLTTQQVPHDLKELVEAGVQFNACSLHQLETYGKLFPGTAVGIRVNPGIGSGSSNKTNVGGVTSSFGIWHEYIDEAKAIAERYRLHITRLHTHIGSGTDPKVWEAVAQLSIAQVENFPDVTTLNLGGGFKVARMSTEQSTDLQEVGHVVAKALQRFADQTGRRLHLEIEPGTFLVANAGSLITRIHDIVDTGAEGYTFLKIDAGMTEILRPTLYGAQHPLIVVPQSQQMRAEEVKEYIVVGHCCESGDLLTPHPHNPEELLPRPLQKASIDDLLVVEGVGAYCAYMSAQNYNSFPLCPEVLKTQSGEYMEIVRRETFEEMLQLEQKTPH